MTRICKKCKAIIMTSRNLEDRHTAKDCRAHQASVKNLEGIPPDWTTEQIIAHLAKKAEPKMACPWCKSDITEFYDNIETPNQSGSVVDCPHCSKEIFYDRGIRNYDKVEHLDKYGKKKEYSCGGMVRKTGFARVHKGELVIPRRTVESVLKTNRGQGGYFTHRKEHSVNRREAYKRRGR